MRILLLLLAIIALVCIIFRFVMVPKAVKDSWVVVNFNSLKLPSTPNYYLSCTATLCPKNNKAYQISPVFGRNVDDLIKAWDKMIKDQPRVSLLQSNKEDKQRVYVQLSALWHFPDFINVKFIALANNQSTIMILSQSHYGHSDFGVNKQRVKAWMKKLTLRSN